MRDVGLTAAGAYRVETDGPVLAVQIVSDDVERKARSSGGTVLRPAQALGARYLALTYPGESSAAVAARAVDRTVPERDGVRSSLIVMISSLVFVAG